MSAERAIKVWESVDGTRSLSEVEIDPEFTEEIVNLINYIKSEENPLSGRRLAELRLSAYGGPGALGAASELFDLARDSRVFPRARETACNLLKAIFSIELSDIDDKKILKFKNYDHFLNTIGWREALVEPQTDSPPLAPASDSEQQTPAAALISLAAHLPSEYDRRAPALAEASHEFRQALATQLAPSLNAKIRAMPHETYEEKKALADWVNGELEPLGLAVQCPRTGQPAKLKADVGDYTGTGRFQFQVSTGEGRPKRTASMNDLPELNLIEAIPGKELGNSLPAEQLPGSWQEAVGPKASRSGRKRS